MGTFSGMDVEEVERLTPKPKYEVGPELTDLAIAGDPTLSSEMKGHLAYLIGKHRESSSALNPTDSIIK